MTTYIANIRLQIESRDQLTVEDIRNELLDFVDYDFNDWLRDECAEIVDSNVNVEESKHGFRVQDSDGNWCEPSDAFADMVKRDQEILAAARKKREEECQ
jgi:hypothetical protein